MPKEELVLPQEKLCQKVIMEMDMKELEPFPFTLVRPILSVPPSPFGEQFYVDEKCKERNEMGQVE